MYIENKYILVGQFKYKKKNTLKINIYFFKTVFRNFMFLKYMGCIVLELGIFEVKKVKPLHCLGT